MFSVQNHKEKIFLLIVLISAAFILMPFCRDSYAASPKQKAFRSPEEAVKSLIGALRIYDTKSLLSIFGPGSKDLLSSGDDVADKARGKEFVRKYDEMNKLQKESPDTQVLIVGEDEWPFPIPMVRHGDMWMFDVKAGKEELLSRRIGRNELSVIEVMHAYANAQREYARKDRDGDGVLEFALKFMSDEGKQDGLYWETKEGKEPSPMVSFVEEARSEGYTQGKRGEGSKPFHGYYFRILSRQGKHAAGGKFDYVVKGNMILGFGLLAYPVKYGNSGIKTFIVNQEGIVYEKDMGKNTGKIAKTIMKYDPDKTWSRAE